MKFLLSTVVAFAAAVLAKPILTNSNFDIVEGEPFTFTWDNAEGEVTLTLKNGDPGNLKDVLVITAGQSGNEFTWTPENLPSDTYAIQITDASGEPNYSKRFDYEGTGTVSSASSSATATASASSAASSSVTSAASSTESASSASSFISASSTASASESSSTTSSTSTSATRTGPITTPTNQNEGQRFSSPLALLLVTVAAVCFFN